MVKSLRLFLREGLAWLGAFSLCAMAGAISASAQGAEASPQTPLTRTYQVNKRVSDFPEREDFSTPEAAYATINRLSASGDESFWLRASVASVRKRFPALKSQIKRATPPEIVKMRMEAKILEVCVYRNKMARVHAEEIAPDGKKRIDVRALGLEDGKWLNQGNDGFDTLEQAREKFARICTMQEVEERKPKQEAPADSQAHLKPYLNFLRAKAQEPAPFVMQALRERPLVIMGEVHHRPRYWKFNCDLVRNPEFARQVGTVYMELPANDNTLIEAFLAAPTLDPEPAIRTLRDMFEMGWPDQAMLEFFETVWKANQGLPKEDRIRIVLVDMERPWERIKTRRDWAPYEVDRDQYMAEAILKDIAAHPGEKRHRLFIVGHGHAMLNFHHVEGTPVKVAGWRLREALGADKVFAFFPHKPAMTNMGEVRGRLRLGLFDAAFDELANKPMAFPLNEGPFGENLYDAAPDEPTLCAYREGYSAYLYLGPLETETFSPLIPGFYAPDFVSEMDRRYKLMYGKVWSELYHKKTTPENVARWMSQTWGRPREWTQSLGPRDAWRYGDGWEQVIAQKKLKEAQDNPEALRNVARRMFEALQKADYAEVSQGNGFSFPPDLGGYTVDHWYDVWSQWLSDNFRRNPIVDVKLGQVRPSEESFNGQQRLPAVEYTLTLKDGRQLKGSLPFYYDAQAGAWCGLKGLDWHLAKKPFSPKP